MTVLLLIVCVAGVVLLVTGACLQHGSKSAMRDPADLFDWEKDEYISDLAATAQSIVRETSTGGRRSPAPASRPGGPDHANGPRSGRGDGHPTPQQQRPRTESLAGEVRGRNRKEH